MTETIVDTSRSILWFNSQDDFTKFKAALSAKNVGRWRPMASA